MSMLLKALFTNRCRLCGEVIELDEEFCECCKNPPIVEPPLCESCGCSKEDCCCKKHKNEFKRVVAPFYYEDNVIPAILRLKEQDMPQIADYLSEKMANAIMTNYSNINFDFICFVPMSNLKIRYRGYNQSELLANDISKLMGIKVEDLLYKRRYTKALHKSNQKRATAVFGAFDIYEECKTLVEDKTILLVDDVKTTGATLNECAKMLKIYGAKAVYCVSAAITKKAK